MVSSKSILGNDQILSALTSGDGSLVLSTLEEIEGQDATRQLAEILQSALPKLTDPVLAFQAKKTWRMVMVRLKGPLPKIPLDALERLLKTPDRLEDLALAISCLGQTEAILATDLFRAAGWKEFPPPILPTFCRFFQSFGNVVDAQDLIELSRHPDPTVLTAALTALETIDPSNLQSLILPLLSSPQLGIRAQAIRTLYRWDKATALRSLTEMLFAKDPQEQTIALHHAGLFPFPEIEPHLLRFVGEIQDPKLLMRVSQIMKANAHLELPFRLFWMCRNLKGPHQNLVKGILIGVARTLSDAGIIHVPAQEFLDQLKIRAQQEEERVLRATFGFDAELKALDAEIQALDSGMQNLEKAGPAPSPASGELSPGPSDRSGSAQAPPTVSGGLPASGSLPGERIQARVSGAARQGGTVPPPAKEPARGAVIEPSRPAGPPSGGGHPAASAPPAVAPPSGPEELAQLEGPARLQALQRITPDEYPKFRTMLLQGCPSAKGKELTALIKTIGRCGVGEDAAVVKPYLTGENPDEVGAAIEALTRLDPEHLSIYLPQLMQDKNGKVRMQATRAFSGIDRERIRSLLTGLLSSQSTRQRTLAIPASMLVDFSLVREPLTAAFEKETTPELISKLGMVLTTNPDRETFQRVFAAWKNAPKAVQDERKAVLDQMAAKLSVALGKIATPEELLTAEEANLAKAIAAAPPPPPKPTPQAIAAAAKKQEGPTPTVKEILVSQEKPAKEKRARLTVVVWLLVVAVWVGLLASLAFKYLFGT